MKQKSKYPETLRRNNINFYLTDKERYELYQSVEASRLSVSEFIRQSLKIVIESEILNYEDCGLEIEIEEVE